MNFIALASELKDYRLTKNSYSASLKKNPKLLYYGAFMRMVVQPRCNKTSRTELIVGGKHFLGLL